VEDIKKLLIRFWPAGALFLTGLVLIIYIAFGFVYLQQGAKQKDLEEQITKLTLIVARPLPSDEELQAEYKEVNSALTPMTDSAAIAKLVGIAQKNGIDVSEDSGMFRVPSASFSQVKMSGGNYQLLSFGNIYVQGGYGNVMAFISDLDSGKTPETKTMVLTRVVTSKIEVQVTGEEEARRAEFRKVAAAVMNMMDDIALSEIPHPMNLASGVATNLMGDDPDTEGTVEGFPDITTTVADRGYSGNTTPRTGYVLYNHDKISTDDTTLFETVSYIDVLTTNYYYTCEDDGTVHQFDGADVATATEYLSSAATGMGLTATVDVVIYTKL